jgi:hypothetical protein
VLSLDCQCQLTVQLSGTTTWTPPSRYPLMSADGAPAGAVTTRFSVTVRAALSATSHSGVGDGC